MNKQRSPSPAPRRASGYKQPSNWPRIRARIIARDRGICHVCRQPGSTSVDHLTPVAEGGGHGDANLAAIHVDPCHKNKTEAERLKALRTRQRTRPPRRDPRDLF